MIDAFDPFAIYGVAEDDCTPVDDRPVQFASSVPVIHSRPIASVFWAENGGPIRTIIDGRKTRPTGFFRSIKGGSRSMPWDSFLEERTMQLADLSSRVHYLLAQPHRIEVAVRGNRGRPLVYFPDLLLRTETSFARDLDAGMSFVDGAAVPTSRQVPDQELETVIIEVKADVDPRDEDERYQTKLEFVKEVYRRRGFRFFVIRDSKHLRSAFIRTVRLIDWRKSVVIDFWDEQRCLDVFGGGSVAARWQLERALGGGILGRAKLHGLHYRGFVSVDLRSGVVDDAPVYLLQTGGDR
ncbi:hypothetical protein [Rhizobium sp. BR 315]|uniref:hypothetical protein n=1 Tax=Rhizobium sp. BR 315 TaxID=3040014 RepID=UPI003D34959E